MLLSEMNRELLQQLYNIAISRNPILFLYTIKKLDKERPFLKKIQEKGYFTIKESDDKEILKIIKFFDKYPDEERYSMAKSFIKKLTLLGISYKLGEGKYSIENQLNINFEKGGASLKQIHKSVGGGYTKSYVQKVIVGKLKHPRSPNDGKIYPIINSESIPNQKSKLFTLDEIVYNAIENEEKNLKGVISELFFYELELRQYFEEILNKRKKLSQIQVQLENFDKEIEVLKSEHNQINKINEAIKKNQDFQEKFELLIESMKEIQNKRKRISKLIRECSNFKVQVENFLKKINRLSFAELQSFFGIFTESISHFNNKNINLFQILDKLIHNSKIIINEMSTDKISEIKYDYQAKNLQYINLKNKVQSY